MFGERLRRMREFRGLTQDRLGALVDTPGTNIARYESEARKPDPEMLAKLADALRISVDYLLGRVSEPEAIIAFHSQRGYLGLSRNICKKIKELGELIITEEEQRED